MLEDASRRVADYAAKLSGSTSRIAELEKKERRPREGIDVEDSACVADCTAKLPIPLHVMLSWKRRKRCWMMRSVGSRLYRETFRFMHNVGLEKKEVG